MINIVTRKHWSWQFLQINKKSLTILYYPVAIIDMFIRVFKHRPLCNNEVIGCWNFLPFSYFYYYYFPPKNRRFGTKCGGCSQGILPSDLVRRAKSKVFHLNCFTCMMCNKQLSTGEELYILDEFKFVCKEDYQNNNGKDTILLSGDLIFNRNEGHIDNYPVRQYSRL